jgi:hypothetical protein
MTVISQKTDSLRVAIVADRAARVATLLKEPPPGSLLLAM